MVGGDIRHRRIGNVLATGIDNRRMDLIGKDPTAMFVDDRRQILEFLPLIDPTKRITRVAENQSRTFWCFGEGGVDRIEIEFPATVDDPLGGGNSR